MAYCCSPECRSPERLEAEWTTDYGRKPFLTRLSRPQAAVLHGPTEKEIPVPPMKVLVSGSLRGFQEARREQLGAAARDLGKCLAEAGHVLLVGSEDPEDVDPFVVEGFQSVEKAPPVEVHLMKGAGACYSGNAKAKNIWHRYDDWDVTVLEVVRYHADGVIVIGGRTGVVQAGIAGWMLGRPIIPFGGFGGGAKKVWEYGSSDRRRFYFDALSDAEIDQLDSPWMFETAATIVDQLGRCAESARRATISLTLRLGISVAILCTLILWVILLALPLLGWPEFPSAALSGASSSPDKTSGFRLILLLASVCSAGAFGALVQSMRGIRDGKAINGQKALIDAVLGIAAGFLTAALYMLAQIAISGRLDLPATPADYSRVALIVSMAAVFASLYLDAAFSRFDLFKESVMSGTYGRKADGG